MALSTGDTYTGTAPTTTAEDAKVIKDAAVKKTIEKLELPKNTRFAGYVVHLPDSDEFLAMSTENEHTENRIWARMPGMAKKYKTLEKANKEARKYGKGANAALLFDIGEQYVLSLPE